MTVKVRPYRNGGFEVDILIRLDDGRKYRERRKSPVESKTGSLRWGQDRERYLLRHGPDGERCAVEREVPTFAEFAPRYIERDAKARRLKPATIYQKETMNRLHILPVIGDVTLDEFGEEHIGLLRAAKANFSPNYVNSIVGQALHMIEMGVRWKVCRPPERVIHDRLKYVSPTIEFYEFDEYGRLIEGAAATSSACLAMVLLGGDAGLRRGEMIALEWGDIDFRRDKITVERSDWKGEVGLPKGGKPRVIPMTKRLKAALQSHRHLIGPRVLYRYRKKQHVPVTAMAVRHGLEKAQAAAGLPSKGPHTLRHTFCSHLAMRGVPARVIQELAGHASLVTTQRYMHLTPGALTDAIAMLEGAGGEGGETPVHGGQKSSDRQ